MTTSAEVSIPKVMSFKKGTLIEKLNKKKIRKLITLVF